LEGVDFQGMGGVGKGIRPKKGGRGEDGKPCFFRRRVFLGAKAHLFGGPKWGKD